MWSIVLAVLIFGVLIFIHELGHFLAARICGVRVLEFAIGMGPKIFSVRSKKSGTAYSLRLFPIGGFCSMQGENDLIEQSISKKKTETAPEEPSGMDETVPDSEKTAVQEGTTTEQSVGNDFFFTPKREVIPMQNDPNSFENQSVWKRIFITVAGPFMNVLLGFLLMFVYVLSAGQNAVGTTEIAGFYIAYQGESAENGIQNGDILYEIDDNPGDEFEAYRVYSLEEMEQFVEKYPSESYTLCVYRYDENGNAVEDTVSLSFSVEDVRTLFQSSLSNQTGLEIGDVVTKVNKTSVHTYSELAYEMMNQGYQPMNLTVLRDGVETELTVTLPTMEESGVTFGELDFLVYGEENFGFGTVMKHTFYSTCSSVKMVYDSLFGLASGRYGAEAVSGPVGITKTISEVANTSLLSVLYLVVVISINLGIMNLLPFPALDGGRFFLCLVEIVTRKPIPKKFESVVNFVGMVILLGIAFLVAIKDIISL